MNIVHAPKLTQIKIGFESEEDQEQVYVSTACVCGDANCVWSAGTILTRYNVDGTPTS